MNRSTKILLTTASTLFLAPLITLLVAPKVATTQASYPVVRGPFPLPWSAGGTNTTTPAYDGLDAIRYCTTPSAPDETCVNNALTSGVSSTVLVSKVITLNNPINVGIGQHVHFLSNLVMNFGNNGQFNIAQNGLVTCANRESDRFIIPSTYTRTDAMVYINAAAGYSGGIKNCQFDLPQPDSTDLSTYNQFGGAWVIQAATPRASIINNKIVGAWNGIYVAVAGGSEVNENQIAAYHQSILVDGAYDSIRLINNHIWPYGYGGGNSIATTNQVAAFGNPANVGLAIGRCDGCFVSGLFSFAGTGGNIFTSSLGDAEVEIVASGFETNLTVNSPGSLVSMSSGYIGVPPVSTTAGIGLSIGGTTVTLAGVQVFNAIVPGTGVAAANGAIYCSVGCHLTMIGGSVSLRDQDQSAIVMDSAGSQINIAGVDFAYTTNKAYTKPVIAVGSGTTGTTTTIMTGNTFSPVGTGSHQYFANFDTTAGCIISGNWGQGMTLGIGGGSTNCHAPTGTNF